MNKKKKILLKGIIEKTIPLIENSPIFSKKYEELMLDDMIKYDCPHLKNAFSIEQVYNFFLKYKFLKELPKSISFLIIFYYASLNITFEEAIEEIKKRNVLYSDKEIKDEIRDIRNNIDPVRFLILNFSKEEIRREFNAQKFWDLAKKIIDLKLNDKFPKVEEWRKAANSNILGDYFESITYLEGILDSYYSKYLELY